MAQTKSKSLSGLKTTVKTQTLCECEFEESSLALEAPSLFLPMLSLPAANIRLKPSLTCRRCYRLTSRDLEMTRLSSELDKGEGHRSWPSFAVSILYRLHCASSSS